MGLYGIEATSNFKIQSLFAGLAAEMKAKIQKLQRQKIVSFPSMKDLVIPLITLFTPIKSYPLKSFCNLNRYLYYKYLKKKQ